MVETSFVPPGVQRDLLQRNEAGNYDDIKRGYVPTPSSGLTVGRGVDLAQVTQLELIQHGLPAYLAYKIPDVFFAPGPGMKGPLGQAAKAIKAQNPFSLTDDETVIISEVVLKLITDRTRNLFDHKVDQYNRTYGKNSHHFDELRDKEQTILVDMAFVAGSGFGTRTLLKDESKDKHGNLIKNWRELNIPIENAHKVWNDLLQGDFVPLPSDITALRGPKDRRGQLDVEFLNSLPPNQK